MCEPWRTARGPRLCAGCRRRISVTAGTIFEGTRKPLKLWFIAAWEITAHKYVADAGSVPGDWTRPSVGPPLRLLRWRPLDEWALSADAPKERSLDRITRGAGHAPNVRPGLRTSNPFETLGPFLAKIWQ